MQGWRTPAVKRAWIFGVLVMLGANACAQGAEKLISQGAWVGDAGNLILWASSDDGRNFYVMMDQSGTMIAMSPETKYYRSPEAVSPLRTAIVIGRAPTNEHRIVWSRAQGPRVLSRFPVFLQRQFLGYYSVKKSEVLEVVDDGSALLVSSTTGRFLGSMSRGWILTQSLSQTYLEFDVTSNRIDRAFTLDGDGMRKRDSPMLGPTNEFVLSYQFVYGLNVPPKPHVFRVFRRDPLELVVELPSPLPSTSIYYLNRGNGPWNVVTAYGVTGSTNFEVLTFQPDENSLTHRQVFTVPDLNGEGVDAIANRGTLCWWRYEQPDINVEMFDLDYAVSRTFLIPAIEVADVDISADGLQIAVVTTGAVARYELTEAGPKLRDSFDLWLLKSPKSDEPWSVAARRANDGGLHRSAAVLIVGQADE